MDQVQLRLADLAALGPERVSCRGYAVDPEEAPLFAVVNSNLKVETICLDAIGVHFVYDRSAGVVGYDEIPLVSQPKLAELIEGQYLLGFGHIARLSLPSEIAVSSMVGQGMREGVRHLAEATC